MKIYLVRHTAVNVEQGVCYGQSDVPLKDSFEGEATQVCNQLSKHQFDKAYTSPLTRCKQLAAFCGYADATPDDRLKELNFGEWEMKRWKNLDMSVWESDWVNEPVPGGESFRQMYDRVAAFFDELKESPYHSVLLFAHGGVLRCAEVYFKGIALEN
ncbi:MAG: alpha-ribazole phosphatase, partial [Phocaeicola sp.]